MSNYPGQIDDDTTLPPVNDNIDEIGGDAINGLRDAVINIETTLGINVEGSAPSLAARLGVSLNADGSLNTSVLYSLGLVTLPVTNEQIANNAGIPESKLILDYPTLTLFNYIRDLSRDVNTALGWISVSGVKLEPHLIGAIYRHDLAQIDVAEVAGQFLDNVFRALRDNSNSYTLINDMNNELLAHQWADGSPSVPLKTITTNDGSTYSSYFAHVASGIYLDTSRFQTIPQTDNNVQLAMEYIDSSSILLLGTRIQNLYANGISVNSRSSSLQTDGYGQPIVPVTAATTFFLFPAGTSSSPVDDVSHGDDVIQFNPTDGYNFDAQFAQVRVGDIIRVNYDNGIEIAFVIENKKYIPGFGGTPSQYFVRIAGRNIASSTTAQARIDRPLFNNNKFGVLGVAAVNTAATGAPASLIVGHPRSAQTLGIGFNADQLDSSHYLLYLVLYPDGNPADGYTALPGIDVTGNLGATPGAYTLDSVVAATNAAFQTAGFNYRFIAFEYQGEFGIMLADSYGGAAFSIVNAPVVQGGTNAGQYDSIGLAINFPNNVVSVFPTNLPGNFLINPGSSNVTASISQTSFLSVGTLITFGSQLGSVYTVLTVVGTAITLTTNYSGLSAVTTTGFISNGPIPDPLGIGFSGANVASPPFQNNYTTVNAAQLPTQLFVPLRRNNYYVNGVESETLNLDVGQALDQYGDGYWVASITNIVPVPGVRTQVTYTINQCLSTSQLKIGKTIVVQPYGTTGALSNYGRFIITNVSYENCSVATTTITVYDAVHGTGVSPSPSTTLPLNSQVAIYFDPDSVSFDSENVSDFNSYVPGTTKFKRHFEIYVDDAGNTYTHERARMSLSSGFVTINNVSLYGSSNLTYFDIVGVSPTLRGFTFSGLNKINFQLVNYDQTTGLYEGYLCNYNGTTISQPGPVTFGQKGQVTRFYDYTNVDYIDLNIVSTANVPEIISPLNIDFQLFPTLSLDQEVMLLGTCQFNDASGQVNYSEDDRQFGNVSEEQFTTSAIEFIQAPTRELHENGIIRGFDFLQYTSDTVSFTGGEALVNGVLVQVNPQTVTIPAVFEALPITIGGPPTVTNTVNSITWFVCVNQDGDIELIASTDFDPLYIYAAQYETAGLNHLRLFYAMNPNAATPVPYNIRGTYFSNLVLTQRDVTPIAIVYGTTTNPGSGNTLTDILYEDARRYVVNGYGGLAEPFVLGPYASFRSFNTVNAWLTQFNNFISAISQQSNAISNKVIVKGHTGISSPIELYIVNNEIYIEGDNGHFDIYGPTGFNFLSGNVHFNNINFNCYYDPTVVYDPLAYVQLTGNFTINGTNTVTTTSSQVGILKPGSVVVFAPNYTNVYAVATVGGSSITLTTAVVGSITTTGYFGGYNTNDLVNTHGGALYIGVGAATKNISVTNCHFNWYPSIAGLAPLFTTATSTGINRYSFINVELAAPTITSATILQGLKINNNTFYDNTLVTFSGSAMESVRAAVSIISIANSPAALYPGNGMKLVNVTIRDNVCDKDQMIIIAPVTSTTPGTIGNTMDATSVLIENNICGTISVCTQYNIPYDINETFTLSYQNFVFDKNNGLIIRGNTCKYIASLDSTGLDIALNYTVFVPTTGPMIISDNTTSWLKILLDGNGAAIPCVIKNNNFNAYDTRYQKLFTNGVNTQNAAIQIDMPANGVFAKTPLIDGNFINLGEYSTITPALSVYYYDVGVYVYQHDAEICNNIIANLSQTVSTISPVGVWLQTLGGISFHSDIHHNKFYRDGLPWTSYIFLGSGGEHTVSDNFFDALNPFGTYPANFEAQISGNLGASSIRGNVNQVVTEVLSLMDHKTAVTSVNFSSSIAQTTIGPAQTAPVFYNDGYQFQMARYSQNAIGGGMVGSTSMYVVTIETVAATAGSRIFSFTVPLTGRLPQGVKILSLQMGVWASLNSANLNTSSDYNAFTLTLNKYNDNATSGSANSGIVDVKNNVAPYFSAYDGTDESLAVSNSDTFLVGTVASSGNNATGTYRVITQATAQSATQYLDVYPTTEVITGGNYRLAVQFDGQYLASMTPIGGIINWYLSPILVAYTW